MNMMDDAEGFTVIRGFCDPIIDQLREETNRIMKLRNECVHLEKNSDSVRTIYGVHLRDQPTYSETFLWPMKWFYMMRNGDWYCHRTWMNCKAPETSEGWNWHQDFYTWNKRDFIPEPKLITMAVLLDDCDDEDQGPLCLIPHSHAETWDVKPTKTPEYSDHSRTDPDIVQSMLEENNMYKFYGSAGDVIFYDNILHYSKQNTSDKSRRIMFYAFNPCSNRPYKNNNENCPWSAADDWSPAEGHWKMKP